MSLAFVTNDLHLGRTSQSVDLDAELLRYVDWLCKEASDYPTLEDRELIVAGDFFEPKRSLTLEQNKLFKKVLKKLTKAFERVYFVLGNHDVPGRQVLDDNLFQFFDLPGSVEVVSVPTRVTIGKVDIAMYPYGKFEPQGPCGGNKQIHITHDNVEKLRGKTTDEILNGHIHTWSIEDNIENLGTPYQLEWSNVGNPGGVVIVHDDGTRQRISYPRKTFTRVRLEAGKIDGKNPVKWITENRDTLKGACLEVSIDEKVDKTLYSKFLGVLATIDLADLKLVDDISFTTDQPLSDSKPNFTKSLTPLLTREGAKTKIENVINELGA